jgi:TM2 domain-containing membrane protein YozV
MAYLVFAALGVVTILFSWTIYLLYRDKINSVIGWPEFAFILPTLGSIIFFYYKFKARKLEDFRQKVKKHWTKCLGGSDGFTVDQSNS